MQNFITFFKLSIPIQTYKVMITSAMADMSIEFQKEELQDYIESTKREWLVTNGLGGWASGTLSGTHTRRYHSLLTAALHPPVGRQVLVSKFSESIITAKGVTEIDSNNFNGVIHPKGYQYITHFEQDVLPSFIYEIGLIKLRKTIGMQYEHNTTFIIYEVLDAPERFTLRCKPFVACRDYHWLSKANDNIRWSYAFSEGLLKVKPYDNMTEIQMYVPKSEFHYSPDWFYNYLYQIEQERGQDFREDLFTYGEFNTQVKKGDVVGVVISSESQPELDAVKLWKAEVARKQSLLKSLPADEFSQQLGLAADQFIVKRGADLKTIIAGYHWFSDWGRDTMISLPGLCLVTGRFEDAKKILKAFANAVDGGMIPNRFPDEGETPEYNNVDGTLWYFIACYWYVIYSGDMKFIQDEIYPVLEQIVDKHLEGTRYHIRVDERGLLHAGDPGTQLTWMDAKVGDWVVTSRHGMPVEINALWYNAQKIMAYFAELFKLDMKQAYFESQSEKTKQAFLQVFLKPDTHTLYDTVRGDFKEEKIRPNQLFAISLPFALVDKTVAQAVVKEVEHHLYTPKGLRSLSLEDLAYVPFYQGNQLSRDGSYHQGTTWSWLLGPFLEAKLKAEGKTTMPKVKKMLSDFAKHLREAGIGQVSEIFDGTPPFEPKGCMAQAWGVAEPLRIHLHYVLEHKPRKITHV